MAGGQRNHGVSCEVKKEKEENDDDEKTRAREKRP